MIVHFALSPDPNRRHVACSSDCCGAMTRWRTTSVLLTNCGNCKRTRRYREAAQHASHVKNPGGDNPRAWPTR